MFDYETDTDYDTDTEDYEDIIYEPEEISTTRFNIALCELYNTNVHGAESSVVLTHYLVMNRYKNLTMDYIDNDINYNIVKYYFPNNQFNINHELFPNYCRILSSDHFFKPQIAECIELTSGHCIGIIKTFWIKIIQRTWKKICRIKKEIIQERKSILSLRNREMTGYWNRNCYYLPSMKGMLYFLKSTSS